MKTIAIMTIALVCTLTATQAQPLPYPLPIDSTAARAPDARVFRANQHQFRLTFTDDAVPSDLTGADVFMAWSTYDEADAVVTAAVSITSATGGVAVATFAPSDLNYAPGRYMYEAGIRDGDAIRTYQQGSFRIAGSPMGAGVDPVTWLQLIRWNLYTYTNTATHGPVRPDGTTIAKTDNDDGSITLAVIAEESTVTTGDTIDGDGSAGDPLDVTQSIQDGATAGGTAYQPADPFDYSWIANPPSLFTGAGTTGLVSSTAEQTDRFLRGDGSWALPTVADATVETDATIEGVGTVADPLSVSQTIQDGATAGATALQPDGDGSGLSGITAAQVGASPTGHPHIIDDVDGLQGELDGKASTQTVDAIDGILQDGTGTWYQAATDATTALGWGDHGTNEYVTRADTNLLDWTGADIEISTALRASNPVNLEQMLGVFQDQRARVLYAARSPSIFGVGSFLDEPPATYAVTNVLAAGTNDIFTGWYTNAVDVIRPGYHSGVIWMERTIGNSDARMMACLMYSDDGGATTNLIVSTGLSENINSGTEPYFGGGHQPDVVEGTNLWYGVCIRVVRAAGGSGATIITRGGVEYPSHVETPGFGTAGFLTEAAAAATYVPLPRTITINSVTQDLSADREWTIDSGWVSTAESDLNMAGFSVTGATDYVTAGGTSLTDTWATAAGSVQDDDAAYLAALTNVTGGASITVTGTGRTREIALTDGTLDPYALISVVDTQVWSATQYPLAIRDILGGTGIDVSGSAGPASTVSIDSATMTTIDSALQDGDTATAAERIQVDSSAWLTMLNGTGTLYRVTPPPATLDDIMITNVSHDWNGPDEGSVFVFDSHEGYVDIWTYTDTTEVVWSLLWDGSESVLDLQNASESHVWEATGATTPAPQTLEPWGGSLAEGTGDTAYVNPAVTNIYTMVEIDNETDSVTLPGGLWVDGSVNAWAFAGDGSGITNLTGANIQAATVPASALAEGYTTPTTVTNIMSQADSTPYAITHDGTATVSRVNGNSQSIAGTNTFYLAIEPGDAATASIIYLAIEHAGAMSDYQTNNITWKPEPTATNGMFSIVLESDMFRTNWFGSVEERP